MYRRNLSAVTLALLTKLAIVLWLPLATSDELSPVPDGIQHELALPDLDGRRVTLGDYRGKVLLVNFWASWCQPCVQEMPGIMRLQTAMRGYPFQVIGINVAEAKRRVRTVAKRLGLDFPVVLDRDSTVFEAWGAEVLPTSYVIDADGRTRYVVLGPRDWDEAGIVERLQALARQPSGSGRLQNQP